MTTFGGGGGGGRKSLTSARGLLALLEEPLDALKIHGLRCLNDCAMTAQWAEVAASLDVIESMHEDECFSRRDLAALVASKVRRELDACIASLAREKVDFRTRSGSLFSFPKRLYTFHS